MVLGVGAMTAMGEDFNTALFVGAALTATSVGITARCSATSGRSPPTRRGVVLGAAVADDVMGLVVLTVVVRLVTEGSVSALSVAGIVAVAVLFLVLGSVVGLRIAPTALQRHRPRLSLRGDPRRLALAFTLGVRGAGRRGQAGTDHRCLPRRHGGEQGGAGRPVRES